MANIPFYGHCGMDVGNMNKVKKLVAIVNEASIEQIERKVSDDILFAKTKYGVNWRLQTWANRYSTGRDFYQMMEGFRLWMQQ